MTRKLMMMVAAVAAAFGAWAATETIGGYKWTYQINGDTAEITGVSPSAGVVTIPSSLGGKRIVSIGHWAFEWRGWLTSVTMPASVTSGGRHEK